MTASAIPQKQYAVQLVGPGELKVNTEKEVFTPGPTQILAKVEAVGLCFSDLKLLKQFRDHARKSEVISGMASDILAGIPSYVPGDKPTVPGHEVVATIVAVGAEVKQHKVGERVLVQTDYRDLPTAASNSAFGYNFEGALQEYVLMDERVVVSRDGERYLIPVEAHIGASQAALVEPWACVEDSYVTLERRTIKAGGRLLVVAEADRTIEGVYESFSPNGAPGEIDVICADEAQRAVLGAMNAPEVVAREFTDLPNENYDDIIFFGSNPQVIETLSDKLTTRGIINIVLGGAKIGRPVNIGVGRVHYGMTRWIGTTGTNAHASYAVIPATGEVRTGDKVVVIGAGGPMGQMHVIRDVCSGLSGLEVVGTDMDDSRLASIEKKAAPMAAANGVKLRMVNTKTNPLDEKFSYIAVMAPVGALVAQAIKDSLPGALINIFAGIPAPVKHDLDLDTYIANRVFMFGTSGSTIRDMKIVLNKVTTGTLATDASVDAVSGMAGALEGLAAVENRTLAGKIIVYPMLHEMGLIPLSQLKNHYPTVAAKLVDDQWNADAEQELLRVAVK
jgi:threonine dehydrogenase-like Zn-dependent dehydrogenase